MFNGFQKSRNEMFTIAFENAMSSCSLSSFQEHFLDQNDEWYPVPEEF